MNADDKKEFRGWEYAIKGDYHRNLDPNWSYTPTYLKKMHYVRSFLDNLPQGLRILDAGCGEGVLVEEYIAKGFDICGIDLNYESDYVLHGDILNMPYKNEEFDAVLLLDVFEHIPFTDQPKVLKEISRILKPRGKLLAAIPNLAHMNSRIRFLLFGVIDRTDIIENHLGERPMNENVGLLKKAGFAIGDIRGITLTLPIIYGRLICHWPSKFIWLHNILDFIARPKLAMLNIFICEKMGNGR
jgi:SAM-dependent methyltransferase